MDTQSDTIIINIYTKFVVNKSEKPKPYNTIKDLLYNNAYYYLTKKTEFLEILKLFSVNYHFDNILNFFRHNNINDTICIHILKNQLLINNLVYVNDECYYCSFIKKNAKYYHILFETKFINVDSIYKIIVYLQNIREQYKLIPIIMDSEVEIQIKINFFEKCFDDLKNNELQKYFDIFKPHMNNDILKKLIVKPGIYDCNSSSYKNYILTYIIDKQIFITFNQLQIMLNRSHGFKNIEKCVTLNNIPINKKLIMFLISKKLQITHNIPMDMDILNECSTYHYYPYPITIIPSETIFIKELKKKNNLEIIKKMHEIGFVPSEKHLLIACEDSNNGLVIEYLLNLGIKPTMECLKMNYTYQKIHNNVINTVFNENENNNTTYKLNDDALLKIVKYEKTINESEQYELKNKIKELFNITKNKKYNIHEIEVFFIEHLLKNNLVIDNYFIINKKLSEILKIKVNSILSINEIKNMVCYFINI